MLERKRLIRSRKTKKIRVPEAGWGWGVRGGYLGQIVGELDNGLRRLLAGPRLRLRRRWLLRPVLARRRLRRRLDHLHLTFQRLVLQEVKFLECALKTISHSARFPIANLHNSNSHYAYCYIIYWRGKQAEDFEGSAVKLTKTNAHLSFFFSSFEETNSTERHIWPTVFSFSKFIACDISNFKWKIWMI